MAKSSSNGQSSVQVAVRVRPMLSQEAGNTQCVDVLSSNSVDLNVVQLGGEAGPKFTFDEVFPIATKQSTVYKERVLPLVNSCMEGYNATILAYGQTGSGKTFTIMGPSTSLATSVQDEINAGVIPRAIQKIFMLLSEARDEHNNTEEDVKEDTKDEYDDEYQVQPYQFEVRVQFLEVYGEDIRDLLVAQQGSQKLSIRDVGLDEPEVVGASEQKVDSPEEAILCLTRGMYRRVTGATAMNSSSSRSHAIFSLIVEQSIAITSKDGPDNLTGRPQAQSMRSKFNFVDLAGSERQKRTKAEGLRLKEGIDINQGLLVLGNVISALGDPSKRGKAFVPYRDSKLTRLLKGSLGGNHKTLMIACVSPSRNNMEETLNCLRYANRAKNIQNHAVVNMDATSRLVAGLRSKMQMLAAELLKAQDENQFECSIPIEVIESISRGGDGEGHDVSNITPLLSSVARNVGSGYKNKALEMELHKLKAENEAYKIQITSGKIDKNEKREDDSFIGEVQNAFVERSTEYEREIAQLKEKIQASSRSRPHQRSSLARDRSESPEMRRLQAQILGSMADPRNLDAEVEAEEHAAREVMARFLRESGDDAMVIDEQARAHGIENLDAHPPLTKNGVALRLEADLHELSNSIDAKEDLIQKLMATQEKFEAMRQFYEDKLHEMETLLSRSEIETKQLSQELDRLEKGHSSEAELQKKLKQKREQVAQLRKKQTELTRLTSVATRNESQIVSLRIEVTQMKKTKTDLQKQIVNERKKHAVEVQKLKKQSMQKERELNKVKRISNKRATEAEKAKTVAKFRLEHINQLKSKYKESEKRLRLQTLQRGVMNKAGFDSVMVGRRDSRRRVGRAGFDADSLREFFDGKVADVGRKEALAEKLAQEWEEHLELSIRKQELQMVDEKSEDAKNTLDSKIKYKEDRIRQLATKLGKRQKNVEENHEDDSFLFDRTFRQIVGSSSRATSEAAARVLFGMVVRERRRIATLARTASLLDERVQEAEAASMSKDEAFRSYINEQRLEAVSLAQNQQEHILSLMEMVKEEPEESAIDPKGSSKPSNDRSSSSNSKLLLLANERISVLENQLDKVLAECEDLGHYRQKEELTRAELKDKTSRNKQLIEEIKRLRSTLRRVRDDVEKKGGETSMTPEAKEGGVNQQKIVDEISNALRSQQVEHESLNVSKAYLVDSNGSFDLEYNSDDDDEVPYWAEDIMKDLAVIAEGKMPSSLLGSTEVVDAEARLEERNVFDRLTNPSSFTGVQKQKKHKANRPPKPVMKKDSDSEGSEPRPRRPVKVTASLSELVVSSDVESPQSHRSIFDRLASPSNATGIQKNQMQDSQRSKCSSRSMDDQSQGSFDSEFTFFPPPPLIGNENSSKDPSTGVNKTVSQAHCVHEKLREAESMLDSVLPKDLAASSTISPKSNVDFETQDVFERLTKTTTQAYALKHNVSVAEKLLDSVLDGKDEPRSLLPQKPTHRQVDSSNGKIDDQIDQNHSAHRKRSNSMRKPSTEYKSVFERLHKTPTEAVANRKSNSSHTQASI